MPRQCACCGSESATTIATTATRVRGARGGRTETGTCDVPYCGRCAVHVRHWPAVDAGTVLLLTLFTLGLFVVYYLYRQHAARAACTQWCVGPGPAVHYLGWHGTRHDFDIDSRSFLRAFAAANRKKVAWADRPAQEIIDELDDEPDRSPIRAEPRPDRAAPSPAPAPRPRSSDGPRFIGPGAQVEVAGRRLQEPLVYVANKTAGIDASTVVTSLPVGNAEHAAPLPYWPSYFEASPHQRARYLDWLAGGRADNEIEIGYPFLAYYGFERRALLDKADRDVIATEVRRLVLAREGGDGSFGAYGKSLLALLTLGRIDEIDDREVDEFVGQFAGTSADALAVLLAWYSQRARPLTALHAAVVAASMDGAARGVVAERAAMELTELFAIRYRDRYGDGLVPIGAKTSTRLEYQPASATLVRSGVRTSATLAHVLGRPAQFKPLVDIWNSCVEDLRKLSASRRKTGAATLTADSWAALPHELRRETDHPDKARWEDAVSKAPVVGGFHLVTAATLKRLGDCEESEKITPAQLRRLGETASSLGLVLEPEPRLCSRAVLDDAEFALWRSTDTTCPDKDIYQAAAGLLSVGLSLALSDGAATQEELKVVTQLVNEIVPVDEGLKHRLEALRTVLLRQPDRLTGAARKLQSTRTAAERSKIGRVLVLVAAADGLLGVEEHKALRGVYRALGLSATDLDATLVECDLRLSSDAPVLVDAGSTREAGERIPRPPEARASTPSGVTLDHAAIASIMAETREVASMLASVLGGDDDEEEKAQPTRAVQRETRLPVAELPPGLESVAAALDPRYHPALTELVKKTAWKATEVRDLGVRLKLMPGGIMEAINSWSDEHLGDYLIEEQGDWHIRVEILKRPHA
jgi:hypothetical protein